LRALSPSRMIDSSRAAIIGLGKETRLDFFSEEVSPFWLIPLPECFWVNRFAPCLVDRFSPDL